VGKGKDYHAFRHTFVDYLKQDETRLAKVADLVGHKDLSVTFGTYGKAFDLRIAKEVIDKIEYPGIVPNAIPRFRYPGLMGPK
jgi:integrase